MEDIFLVFALKFIQNTLNVKFRFASPYF